MIRRLIIEYGVPICGSREVNGGYYIPQNDTERLAGIVSIRNQLTEEEKRVSALISADLNGWKDYLKEGD
ncbi:hypothetical protein [uncultured Streptococcus sp.]|uniref:hypothetical protein n=1 Tax=uncultured Streptococcus sp. TaxID=83427 RepID=UPI0027DCD5A1|nr:hypothetical protein [uncultured Streptococcus sp.]